MEPLVAAVWSCDPEVALDYPARYLFTFLEHHGMLGVFGSPQWRTVTGGSQRYVAAVAARLQQVRAGVKVTSVLETSDGVEVTDGNGTVQLFDAVVIATHPGQAIAMLAEPTATQRDVLTAMPYSTNTALLHTDASVLPGSRHAWAAWNFARRTSPEEQVLVTYDLTRLQRLDTETRYLLTLVGQDSGGEDHVDPATVIDRMEYEHPLYNPGSVAAQERLPSIDTDRISFAGAYHGWGFHEDGARSGLAAVERLGLTWPAVLPRSPADDVPTGTYATTIRHIRRKPFARTFTHRSHTWVVDLDDLPDHGVLGRFEARDHLGSADASIRANVEAFLAEHGVDLQRRAGRDGRARAGLRLLLQPDLGLLVLGHRRPTGGHRRRGAQHLRRPARLPRPPRRPGQGHHSQGDVRLAVPRHRRHATSSRSRSPTTAGSTSRSPSGPTTVTGSAPRCPDAWPTSPRDRQRQPPSGVLP